MNSSAGGGWDDEWDHRAWSREGPSGPPPLQQQPPHDQPYWSQPHGHQPQGDGWATDPAPRSGAGVIVGVAALALLVIAALVVVIVVRSGDDDGGGTPVAGEEMVTETSTAVPGSGEMERTETTAPTAVTTTTRASAPSGLVEECVDEGGADLPRAGRGTVETSCPFAIAVREAYLDTARPGDPASVQALSPVTGQTYTMGCQGGEVVTCRGGNNAVVYLY